MQLGLMVACLCLGDGCPQQNYRIEIEGIAEALRTLGFFLLFIIVIGHWLDKYFGWGEERVSAGSHMCITSRHEASAKSKYTMHEGRGQA
eukprot:scaffold6021_cov117-Isochrysis_galbana.AAC.23